MHCAVDHHDEMIEAIESGDCERIVNLIVEHWELSRTILEYFVKPDPLAFEMAAVNS